MTVRDNNIIIGKQLIRTTGAQVYGMQLLLAVVHEQCVITYYNITSLAAYRTEVDASRLSAVRNRTRQGFVTRCNNVG